MAREVKLKAYYEGKNDILKTTKADGKSNIQASHPFASKITNSFVGYFASKAIRMDYEDEDVMALVDDFFQLLLRKYRHLLPTELIVYRHHCI